MDNTVRYNEYRCNECNKLLFKGVLVDSEVEVKCNRCNNLNNFIGEPLSEFTCLKGDCLNRVKPGK